MTRRPPQMSISAHRYQVPLSPPIILAAGLLMVGFFAVFHGHAHGREMSPGQSAILYSIGFVIATGLLHAAGIGIGLIHRWDAGRIALRVGGSWIAAVGMLMLRWLLQGAS